MARSDRRIPYEVWCNVLEYLDAESLLSVEGSCLLSWSVFSERKLRRRITLNPRSDAAELKVFIAHFPSADVEVLHLTNCIFACPVKLLESICDCRLLTELYCVNCRLDLRCLFYIITGLLPALSRIEYSIFSDGKYTANVDFMTCGRFIETNVRCMYVEVTASERSYLLLLRILRSCPRLEELHVHNLGINQLMSIEYFFQVIYSQRIIRTFTHTSRKPDLQMMSLLYAQRWHGQHPSSDHSLSALLCGNVAYWIHPATYSNCLYLSEVVAAPELSYRNLQQAVLSIEVHDATPLALAQAAHQPLWGHLEALTVLLVPAHVLCYSRSPYFGSAYFAPLRELLRACKVLTELNVSSVHFTAEVDFGQILAAAEISQLRALSLAPCAMQSPASLHKLAVSCPRLEELDVHGFHEMFGLLCSICYEPFTAVNAETMRILHEETRLDGLTVVAYGLCSLDFLVNCRVARLQIYWRGEERRCTGHRSLGQLVGANQHLRSLTISCPHFTMKKLCTELYLGQLRSLQSMCAVSSVWEKLESTERLVLHFARCHPSLETLHAHYFDERGSYEGITWMRRRGGKVHGGPQGQPEDALLLDAHCTLDCSMSTYIGLAKPRCQMGGVRY
ncbi:uncharacterized protein LOC144149919 [Haemaphysalis longicornis]